MRQNARALGFRDLYAPVRPTQKAQQPLLSMTEYAALRRPDGLPQDPWLRTHFRIGGTAVKIAPYDDYCGDDCRMVSLDWIGLRKIRCGIGRRGSLPDSRVSRTESRSLRGAKHLDSSPPIAPTVPAPNVFAARVAACGPSRHCHNLAHVRSWREQTWRSGRGRPFLTHLRHRLCSAAVEKLEREKGNSPSLTTVSGSRLFDHPVGDC
jgi:hypothetical protein